MKAASRSPGPGAPRAPAHVPFIEDDALADGHEHGERADTAPRQDDLVGTSGSHTPAPDARAEEPADLG